MEDKKIMSEPYDPMTSRSSQMYAISCFKTYSGHQTDSENQKLRSYDHNQMAAAEMAGTEMISRGVVVGYAHQPVSQSFWELAVGLESQ